MKLFTAALFALLVATPTLAARADQRQGNQQARIVQGAKSGELTKREAAALQRAHMKLQQEIRTERAANGGYLTPAQKRDIERKQDRLSKTIYEQKHDGQSR